MPPDLWKCSLCSYTNPSREVVVGHTSRVHFVCPDQSCKAKFDTRKLLAYHWVATQHRFYCHVCDGGLSSVDALLEHDCTPKTITCQVCKMVAPDQDTYDQHWQDTEGDSRHFRCQTCKVVFRTGHALEQHSKVHRPANITCIFCPNKYCSYSDMIRHIEANGCQNASIESIQARIASIRPYGFCIDNESLNSFYDHGNFKPHDKPYECARCDRSFKNLGSLISHLENSASCGVGVHGRFFGTILAALRDEHY